MEIGVFSGAEAPRSGGRHIDSIFIDLSKFSKVIVFSCEMTASSETCKSKSALPVVASRAARISTLASKSFDILVIGGGIHGACVAKLAARAGLQVALFEQDDFASGTSSRSSKMAHGGLRYLEMLDFKQVFEGIKAREELFERVPHLVRPERFLIPVPAHSPLFKYKLGLGLYLYDLLVRRRERKHCWIPRADLHYKTFHSSRTDLAGCYQYTDGLMNDARLNIELVVSAAMYGATTLNYARVTEIERSSDTGPVTVRWSDARCGREYTSCARIVVNCAGPWVATLQEKHDSSPPIQVRFSRGSHLIFSEPWNEPSLFLPLSERGRYYFVWPHPAGTMVGTTERETKDLVRDPIPSSDEIHEILMRLQKDLPHSGLTQEKLIYAFAGIRTLPIRAHKARVSQISRKHIWHFSKGVLSLFGGKYTTFAWTATEGLRRALRIIERPDLQIPSALDDLPSVLSTNDEKNLLSKLSNRYPAAQPGIARAVSRLGEQCAAYLDDETAWHEIAPGVLMLEVLHALHVEQAECIEDVLRRRLELEYRTDHGLPALAPLVDYLRALRGDESAQEEATAYRARMSALEELLHSPVLGPHA